MSEPLHTSSPETGSAAGEGFPALQVHPEQIGPYHILQTLGEGGMGVVYQAEQRQPVRRVVAIKLIKLGMDSRAVISRFEAERQALALMNHPNIARVFEVGTSEYGRPYFVMEFVEGEPITRFCDRLGLNVRQRLELFIKVCDAVQHAHSKAIIHRDLKPANVLVAEVDGEPVPKVIDFGVAKALNQRLTERTLFTELGVMLGTPEYMSPEQAELAASDIDARSDVFSLGAMLYELLTGTLPIDAGTLRSGAWKEIQRLIREVDPPRPSTRLTRLDAEEAASFAKARSESVATLASKLRQELEWIPLKAMRKDIGDRYRTASEMGDDIRNYLAGRPLIAGPESGLYRARKFLRRNRVSVGVAAAMVVLLLGGIAGTSYQWVRATRQRTVAQQQGQVAEQRFQDVRSLAGKLLADLYPEVDRLAGSGPAVRKIADMSLEYLKKLEEQSKDDPELLGDVAFGYVKLSDIQGGPNVNNTGDYKSAMESLASARRAAERSLAIRPDDAGVTGTVGSIHLKIGDIQTRLGKRTEAEASYALARTHYERAATLAPESRVAAHNRILPAARLAVLQGDAGDLQGAAQTRKEVVAQSRALLERFPNDAQFKQGLAASLKALAGVQLSAGDYAGAIVTAREAVAICEAELKARPGAADLEDSLAGAYSTLFRGLLNTGDTDGAAEAIEKAIPPLRRLYEADPANLGALHGLGATLILQSDVLSEQKRFDEAADVAQETIALYRRGLEVAPDDLVFKQNLIVSYGGLAGTREKQKRYPEALEARETGLALLEPLAAADPGSGQLRAGLAYTKREVAQTLNLMGQHRRALEYAGPAVETFDGIIAARGPNRATLEFVIDARQQLVEAIDGLVVDATTGSDERAALRARGHEAIEELRGHYRQLLSLGGSTNEKVTEELRSLDIAERNLEDESRVGTERASVHPD